MGVIGKTICRIDHLRFEQGLSLLGKLLDGGVVYALAMQAHGLPDFPRQVEPGKVRITVFELVYNAKPVQVVLETAMVFHALVECGFTRVAEGWMTQVMSQRNRLGQVLI